MKRTCVLLSLVCAYTFLSAQETESKFSIGVFASPTIAGRILSADDDLKIFGEIYDEVEAPKPGYSAGMLVSYALNKKLSIQSGVSFTNAGYLDKKTDGVRFGNQFDGTGFNPALPSGEPYTAVKFVHHNYYVNVPVLVKYTFMQKGKFSLYALGGVEANFNVANKHTMILWMDDEKERETRDQDPGPGVKFRKINCSVTAGIGMDVKLSSAVSLFAQVDYHQMLLSNVKDAGIRRRLFTAGLSTGVMINFNKN